MEGILGAEELLEEGFGGDGGSIDPVLEVDDDGFATKRVEDDVEEDCPTDVADELAVYRPKSALVLDFRTRGASC